MTTVPFHTMMMIETVLQDDRDRLEAMLKTVKTLLDKDPQMYAYACGYMESHVEHTIKTLDQILNNLDTYCS
jgi:hypothetical protein